MGEVRPGTTRWENNIARWPVGKLSILCGQPVTFESSDKALGYAIVVVRAVLGWVLFQGGITKVLNPGWTAPGYWANAIPECNPFIGLFASMAGNALIDFLVARGLTLTGIGLIIGALTRWCGFCGAFMMLMFWAAALTGGLAQGLPIAHGWVVDDHSVYAVLLFGLGALGAGRILGVDGLIEKFQVVRDNPTVKYVLGESFSSPSGWVWRAATPGFCFASKPS